MKTSITLSFLLVSQLFVSGQSLDIQKISKSVNPKPSRTEYRVAKQNTNELESLFSGLFLLYKELFSSQDYMRCNFHPSCSEYGMIAVKSKGAAIGMMATFDRLIRCNGLSPENYEFDFDKLLLIDHP
ncbi:MAG: membrane protein insertion efficiency factor YidD [Flavobacteriales bacterium]